MSQPGSYYKTNAGIAINETLCVGGLTEVSREVFHCSLNQSTTRVLVQPGDILGLELPQGTYNSILAFARVSSRPTNYVFVRQGLFSPSALSGRNLMTWKLPQITIDTGSGKYTNNIVLCAYALKNLTIL